MKRKTDYDYIIKEIPVFSGLLPKQQAYIKQKARFLEFKKGQVIYKEGSVPSFFYCIIRQSHNCEGRDVFFYIGFYFNNIGIDPIGRT